MEEERIVDHPNQQDGATAPPMNDQKKKKGRPKKKNVEEDQQDNDEIQKEIEEHFSNKVEEKYKGKISRINQMLNVLDQSVTNVASRFPITSEFKRLFEREAPVLKNQIKNIILELNHRP